MSKIVSGQKRSFQEVSDVSNNYEPPAKRPHLEDDASWTRSNNRLIRMTPNIAQLQGLPAPVRGSDDAKPSAIFLTHLKEQYCCLEIRSLWTGPLAKNVPKEVQYYADTVKDKLHGNPICILQRFVDGQQTYGIFTTLFPAPEVKNQTPYASKIFVVSNKGKHLANLIQPDFDAYNAEYPPFNSLDVGQQAHAFEPQEAKPYRQAPRVIKKLAGEHSAIYKLPPAEGKDLYYLSRKDDSGAIRAFQVFDKFGTLIVRRDVAGVENPVILDNQGWQVNVQVPLIYDAAGKKIPPQS
jgi:hypothetical protein